jgi:hypothetical protein
MISIISSSDPKRQAVGHRGHVVTVAILALLWLYIREEWLG